MIQAINKTINLHKSLRIPKYECDSEATRFSWLKLARTYRVSSYGFRTLLEVFHDPQTALNNLKDLARRGGRVNFVDCTNKAIDSELSYNKKSGTKLIFSCDNDYPELLKYILDPPPVLAMKGRSELLHRNNVAIVGARNASANGCSMAANFASHIGNARFVIVSGLAKGIDAAAHSASIKSGTIGVVAGGIDYIYPKESANLFETLYEVGLVISEHPAGTVPVAANFPQRNRIISGLSFGVLVIEATRRSGTLTTASFAAEQGREVFAIPGSPIDPRHQGTNSLIKQGALLVETPNDVIEEVNMLLRSRAAMSDSKAPYFRYPQSAFKFPSDDELAAARKAVIDKLSYAPINLDVLIEEMEIPAKLVSIVILELELAGRLERGVGNTVVLLYNQQ